MITSTVDADARSRVATDLGATLFVEAGAGTGKTTALVGRVLELVLTGTARLGEIAAITFTEAAAAELRDRVASALERRLVGGAESPLAPEQAQRATAALAEIDQATICTLHSFAQRILVAHALEAGLPPRLQLLDETASAVAFAERWDDFLDRLLADPEREEVVLRARLVGMSITHLRALARAFHTNWDLVADHTPPQRGPLRPIRGATLRAALAEALRLADRCTDPADTLLGFLERIRPWATEVLEAPDGLPLLQALGHSPALKFGNKGTKANWGGAKQEVVAQLTVARDEVRHLSLTALRETLSHLVVDLRELTLEGAAARKAAGLVEFHDLLVLARDLLRARPDVAAQLGDRWRFLLVDEFQDTDPIQAELAVRIAGRPPPGAGPDTPWTRFEVAPGRLFFVGDPKQAIYRFRRADIELFLQMRDLVTDVPLSLTHNFRSVPAVIEAVNTIFEPLFGDGDGTAQPSFEPLAAARPAWPEQPAVLYLGGPTEGGAEVLRELSAADIVAVVQRAREEGWRVGDDPDEGDGPGHPLRLADIAVLVPGRDEAPALCEAFDAYDLPYRLETRSLVFDSPEVADLIAVVRAVADPSDELAVVAALRTPLYACADDDLLRWKLAGGRWDYRRCPPEGAPASVAEAFAHLHALRELSRWVAPATVVDRILADRGAFALALDERRSRDVWRRLRWVADQARTFAEAGGTDLRGWLTWVEVLASDEARVRDEALPESDDDSIRILTIHGSKGLEFPFVVVTGLRREARSPGGVQVLWGPDGPEISVGQGRCTAGFEALAEREATLLEHERLRLQYVAATRAKDVLLLPLHHAAGRRSHAATIWKLVAELGLEITETAPALAPPPTQRADGPEPAPAEGPAARLAWIANRETALHAARKASTTSPTELARLLDETGPTHDAAGADDEAHPGETEPAEANEPVEPLEANEPIEPIEPEASAAPWRRGRGGTALGRAVHGTLQLVDLATGAGLDDLARAQAAAEGVAGRAAEVARLARHALASPTVAGAAGRRTWRELYVGAPIADRLLEGFVDLLVDTPEGLCIVDYKTALGATDAELDQRARGYAVQGAAYAVALEAVVGQPVERFVLVFLRADGAVEREVADLAGAKARIHAHLAPA